MIEVLSVLVVANLPEATDRVHVELSLPSPVTEGLNLEVEFQAPQHAGLDYAREHLIPLMKRPKLEVIDSAIGERKEVRP